MVDNEEKARRANSPNFSEEPMKNDVLGEENMDSKLDQDDSETAINGEGGEESCSSDETELKCLAQEPVCKSKSASSDPNFGVVWSFMCKFGYLLNLPECSIDEMEAEFDVNRKLEKQSDKQGLLEKLHLKLLRRLSKSCDRSFSCLSQVSAERLERTLIKLAKALDLKLAWDLEQFGYHVLTKGEKLLLLKSLCELQFDENPNFRSHLNDEYVKNDRLQSLRLQPFGKDINGRMVWYHEDKNLCIRVYSVEDDDADSVSWKVHASNPDELNDWIQYLKLKSEVNPKDVAFRKRQEKKQEEKAKRKAEEEELRKKKKGKGRKSKGKNNKVKAKETESSDDEDENPCARCFSNNRPELVLLCDKCDAAYHTLCLRPPLMVIPEGDWYCPFCQQETLIEHLAEKLKQLISKKKAAERASKRLDYYGIDLANIVSDEAITDTTDGHRRSCRAKKSIDYKFSDYDDVIHRAITAVGNTETPAKPRVTEPTNVKTFYSKTKTRETRVLSGKELIYGIDEDFDTDESEPAPDKESDDESYHAAVDEAEFLNDAEEEEEDEEEEGESEGSDFEEEVKGKRRKRQRVSAGRKLRSRKTTRRSKRFRNSDDSEDGFTDSDQSWQKFPRTSKRKRSSIKQSYAEFEYSFGEESEVESEKLRKAIPLPKGKTSEDDDYNPSGGKHLWSDEEEEEEEMLKAEEEEEESDLDDLRKQIVDDEEDEALTSSSEEEEGLPIKREQRRGNRKRKVVDDSDENSEQKEAECEKEVKIEKEGKGVKLKEDEAEEDMGVDKEDNESVTKDNDVTMGTEKSGEECGAAQDDTSKDKRDVSLDHKTGPSCDDLISDDKNRSEGEERISKEENVDKETLDIVGNLKEDNVTEKSKSNENKDHEDSDQDIEPIKGKPDPPRTIIKSTPGRIIVPQRCTVDRRIPKDLPREENDKDARTNTKDVLKDEEEEENCEIKEEFEEEDDEQSDSKISFSDDPLLAKERKRRKNVERKTDRKSKLIASLDRKDPTLPGMMNGKLLPERGPADLSHPRIPSGFYDYRFGLRFQGNTGSSDLPPFENIRQPLRGMSTSPCNSSGGRPLFRPMFQGEFGFDGGPRGTRGFSSVPRKGSPGPKGKGSPSEPYPLSPEQCHPYFQRFPGPLPAFGPVLPYPRYPPQHQSRSSGCPSFPVSSHELVRRTEVGGLPPPPQLLHFPPASNSGSDPSYRGSVLGRGERPVFRPRPSLGDFPRHSNVTMSSRSPSEEGKYVELSKGHVSDVRYLGMMSPERSTLAENAARESPVSTESDAADSKRVETSKRPKIWSPYAEAQTTKVQRDKVKEDPLKEKSIVKNYTAFQSMVINPVASHAKTPKTR